MKLITKEIEKKLMMTKIDSEHSLDDPVIVKYFNPYGIGTWLIVAGELQPDGDWDLYGYINLGFWEWGHVPLSELEAIRIPVFNAKLERDIISSGTVAELLKFRV